MVNVADYHGSRIAAEGLRSNLKNFAPVRNTACNKESYLSLCLTPAGMLPAKSIKAFPLERIIATSAVLHRPSSETTCPDHLCQDLC